MEKACSSIKLVTYDCHLDWHRLAKIYMLVSKVAFHPCIPLATLGQKYESYQSGKITFPLCLLWCQRVFKTPILCLWSQSKVELQKIIQQKRKE